MYVDLNTLVWIAGILTAVGVIVGVLYKLFKWYEEQRVQSAKIEEVQEEQTVICYVLLAALDGLKQLGANGEVTTAHDYLSKYINKKAHDQKAKER